MSPQPSPEADSNFPNVVDQTVLDAKASLIAFSNISWQNTDGGSILHPDDAWLVTAQSPSDDIGKVEPTTLEILLTIEPPPMRR